MSERTKNMTYSELSSQQIADIDAYWRAANYISVGQIYLRDNPLLKQALHKEHIKPRLLGHWGTTPGLNFIYVHLNRLIKQYDLNMIYLTGPGHGGPAMVANTYLEGSYTEHYPDITEDEAGLKKLFTQFSFPGGVPSHVAAETPGSIHEGGELGYALSHAYGAAFDNPDLIVSCVIGDGEAETGPLATSWHSNKFLNPVRDGAVLPILHLNGYKIAGPTILARIPRAELASLFVGYGYQPYFVEGDDPEVIHQQMAETLDKCYHDIQHIQHEARTNGNQRRARWPMIVLRTPKGWTGPKTVDGIANTGTFRAHQVPIKDTQESAHIEQLKVWLKSYKPEELFDENGRLLEQYRQLAPVGERRMGANPHANGGVLLKDLLLPDFKDYRVEVSTPGQSIAEATREQGKFLAGVLKQNLSTDNFRIFSPDETASNRWDALFGITDRCSTADIYLTDENVAIDGRVMEMLSEHQCQGWLEGYLLSGRHGFFSSYEAFIHIVGSMFNQHAKWLDTCRKITWRKPVASLNYLLTSHAWRQDHNGLSHQDPGFIGHVLNKKSEVVNVYLPPDANTLLAVTDYCLRSRNKVNVIVAGKQPELQWLDMPTAIEHCRTGISVWDWAGNDVDNNPDLVMACCGSTPTIELMAAVELLRGFLPDISIRVINVVNLMKLHPLDKHPDGLTDDEFDQLFTADKPVVFAFHGYPWLIHRLIYSRNGHKNFHVHGYQENGTTTTPFDMTVLNQLDRYHLCETAMSCLGLENEEVEFANSYLQQKLIDHKEYITSHGEDLPEIQNWKWNNG